MYNVFVNPDPTWSGFVSQGFTSADPLLTVKDVTGVIATTRSGKTTTKHFAFQLFLASALHHPGYGSFGIDQWGAQLDGCRRMRDASGVLRGRCCWKRCGSVAMALPATSSIRSRPSFAHFAEHATSWVWQQLDAATALKLSGGQWNGVLQVTMELGVLVCVTMLLLQVIACALRQDFGGLGRGVRGGDDRNDRDVREFCDHRLAAVGGRFDEYRGDAGARGYVGMVGSAGTR